MILGEASEGGGVVSILLDDASLKASAGQPQVRQGGGNEGNRAPNASGGVIVPTQRVASLPSAPGYGPILGLAVPKGSQEIVVGAMRTAVAGNRATPSIRVPPVQFSNCK